MPLNTDLTKQQKKLMDRKIKFKDINKKWN